VIEVRIGEGAVASHPYILTSAGLGSCVVVALYEIRSKLGGTAHIMLPEHPPYNSNNGLYAYADSAIEKLLAEMHDRGASLQNITAKFTGGSRMFSYGEDEECIGEQNVAKVRDVLRVRGIGVLGEDVGGNHGRSVEFYLDTGKMVVKTLGKGDKVI
jgi:chemotaxis protein CheD